ncbi:DUF2590 family protein [Serratia ficaria]|uniref:DUF2590 family protein n=1 Tax=Serratia ficaria TaxID=61651 RepID=UPI00217C7050|nr:DUF2590 family protein [Serratia ficaria]CAI0760223.1 Protein of uncharacterised function (DUF2590) [Serratia ficaria]CAI1569215.1 Protein of uncharacterised function (DUF2590) [Serratia ficaria]CAI2405142.1 Protein of uncharacterised function (DUF2590) [Serratia ficaria]CAI2431333.1 Protein of uncharacterised function (DUF2590) [Serratia ficaria]CAI2499119.1 Protein of uncharacterised function (DUF2590) [Serratia ficaria]
MAEEKLYIDLLITDRDFTLNAGFEPVLCNNLVSIGQDIKHAIMESGLATQLVAERSPTLRADIILQITLLVENDERLIPSTIYVTEEASGRLLITADTYDFGPLSTGVTYDQ